MKRVLMVLALGLAGGLHAEGELPQAVPAAEADPSLALFFAPLGQSSGVDGAALGMELALARRFSVRLRAQTKAVYRLSYPEAVVEEWLGGTADLRWYYIRPGALRGAFFGLSGEAYHAEFPSPGWGRDTATLSGFGVQTGWQFVFKDRWLLCPAYDLRWLFIDLPSTNFNRSNAGIYGPGGRISGNWEISMGMLF